MWRHTMNEQHKKPETAPKKPTAEAATSTSKPARELSENELERVTGGLGARKAGKKK
jgi:bacteriocin-like protein